MNAALEKSLTLLTHKNNLTEVSIDELSRLVNEYPFFAPAQLALAIKMQADKHYMFDAQLQKTALYFANPQWLEYQFMNGDLKDIHVLNEATLAPSVVEAPQTVTETAIETAPPSEIKQAPAETIINSSFAIPTVESVKEMLSQIDQPPTQKTETISQETSIDTPILPVAHQEEEVEAPTLTAYSPGVEEAQLQKLNNVLSSHVTDFKTPVAEGAKLEFEKNPFFTIDYFASQGIKFDPSKQPEDRLSQQLMTFTDWLKRMKNVSPNPQDLGTDPELENAIQGIANSSNEAKEIITETMAEIFIKQGKLDKAVQLYIKLSFLYPEKSTYFAAKIQELKGM
jgi:hypothetical protein